MVTIIDRYIDTKEQRFKFRVTCWYNYFTNLQSYLIQSRLILLAIYVMLSICLFSSEYLNGNNDILKNMFYTLQHYFTKRYGGNYKKELLQYDASPRKWKGTIFVWLNCIFNLVNLNSIFFLYLCLSYVK